MLDDTAHQFCDDSHPTHKDEVYHHLHVPNQQHGRIHAVQLLKNAQHHPTPLQSSFQLHVDGGANRSITADKTLLMHYRDIKAYAIHGVHKDDAALTCTGMGYLPWRSPDGTLILIKCLYSKDAADTIISPTDIVHTHYPTYIGWTQHSDLSKKSGYIDFISSNEKRTRYPLIEANNLWYSVTSTIQDYPMIHQDKQPTVNRLTGAGFYALIHARMGHPGQTIMATLHQHVDGVPKMRSHPLYKCETCLRVKATKRSVSKTESTQLKQHSPGDAPAIVPGQQFHIDMGFVRGTQFSYRDADGKLVTSLDGYNSYVIIVDRATRYSWVFLAKSKLPQIEPIKQFLLTHGSRTTTQRYVRTDEGGELWSCIAFQNMVREAGFILQPTASDASFQNGIAERPNRTLGDMMRALLFGANLGPEYWSWALLHAVYLKNRLPHRATGSTPMLAYTGKRPQISTLRVFGSPVVSRLPGKRPAKLDAHTAVGIFLGYTATHKNIYYKDTTSGKIKIATHVTFDEAGFTLPQAALSPTQRMLQEQGYTQGSQQDPGDCTQDTSPTISDLTTSQIQQANLDSPLHNLGEGKQEGGIHDDGGIHEDCTMLLVQKLSEHATVPYRATPDAAGLDLFTAASITIPPHTQVSVPTDLAITPPLGTYGQILPRSGIITKHQVDTKAGTIDRDYTGNVHIILHNYSDSPFEVTKGDRIAQLVIYRIAQPTPMPVPSLQQTSRGHNGFGSTGTAVAIRVISTGQQSSTQAVECSATDTILQQDGIKPYDVWLSTDPFQNRLKIQLDLKGDHDTLGLICQPTLHTHRLQLMDMKHGTPGAKLPRWRSTLRRAILLTVNNTPVPTADALKAIIVAARKQGLLQITCEFATIGTHALHPTEGSLHLFYDQMNVIAKHLQEMEKPTVRMTQGNDMDSSQPHHALPDDTGKALSWKEIKKREDLPAWKLSRYKMLDDYHSQGMFSEPIPKPSEANIHHMIWRYTIKMDGTRKSRMVCDGSPRRGTITLGHTYANSLMAASERLFWAITAQRGLVAYGADVTNAFAEAPPPIHPLYMYIDEAFKEWWTEHLKRPPIPQGYTVVRVQNAIQGHPESPRLWERHIDKILKTIGFKATTHEPCLYHGIFNGSTALFLRQVDDFAIATTTHAIADDIISKINTSLRMPMKNLGIITRFNGIEIEQTARYIKIHCGKYLEKMLQGHNWLTPHPPLASQPLPFPADKVFLQKLHVCTVPITIEEKQTLETRMGFKFRQVMGEVMFPMVKCRPDISPHVIYLSQFLDNPGEMHYNALRHICQYLAATTTWGIHYWRTRKHKALTEAPSPELHSDNYTLKQAGTHSQQLVGYVDSDWATSSKKRNSLTGMVLMYAGGAIGYKTKFQTIIAHSSTEAEFVAACDTAKMILFFRSLLDQLGQPQDEATILYEDNTGALLMANAQQPTRRTRHIEIKHFALLDWVEQDLLKLQSISTNDNAADAMTKMLSKQLFYRHLDTYMGHRIPEYVRSKNKSRTCTSSSSSTVKEHGGGIGPTYVG